MLAKVFIRKSEDGYQGTENRTLLNPLLTSFIYCRKRLWM